MARRKIALTLIHNDAAGDADHGREWLQSLLRRAGYEVAYVPAKRADLATVLGCPAELVAVAGGDGTIAKVAAQARPDGPPLAILPLGTANNIAKSLGLGEIPIEELVERWAGAEVRPFYPIDATGPWGERRIIEGIGFGAVEEAITELPDKTDTETARQTYAEAVAAAHPEILEIRVDDEAIRDAFPLLEIATIPLIGPNLPLATGADPHERYFEICFIRDTAEAREALANWIGDPDSAAAPVSIRVTERATISGKFRRVRIDGGVKPTTPEREWDYSRPITLTAASEPVPFLVP